MKKMPILLMGILAFTAIVAFINAKEDTLDRTDFRQYLEGTFVPASMTESGPWVTMKQEFITGTAQGDLPYGPQVMFTIISNRRFRTDDGKSFLNGAWKFVSPNEDEISGILTGKGTTLNEFSGMFVTTESDAPKHTQAHHAKIQGEFHCWMAPLPPYGNLWEFRAWWNGTYRGGGD